MLSELVKMHVLGSQPKEESVKLENHMVIWHLVFNKSVVFFNIFIQLVLIELFLGSWISFTCIVLPIFSYTWWDLSSLCGPLSLLAT